MQIVHISGLIAALSPETSTFCLELARAAKKHGTRISFDLNHRATFWEGREEELREVFTEIAGLTDILIGNEEDYQLCLGIQGPEAGGEDIAEQIDGFKKMIGRVKESFRAPLFLPIRCGKWKAPTSIFGVRSCLRARIIGMLWNRVPSLS